ncbi:hypothetical protein VTN77DRAFT_7083 [Rasamsonia byssochlamydoides]|uniref:uncharacterized protein n=1 Tax=Rasamsonia byssochlamydoides TaxID=89139 RepID=UPI003742B273
MDRRDTRRKRWALCQSQDGCAQTGVAWRSSANAPSWHGALWAMLSPKFEALVVNLIAAPLKVPGESHYASVTILLEPAASPEILPSVVT